MWKSRQLKTIILIQTFGKLLEDRIQSKFQMLLILSENFALENGKAMSSKFHQVY